MIRLGLLILMLMCSALLRSQELHHFSYDAIGLDRLLAKAERKFDVRYSYADSLVDSKKITLLPARYTLERLHAIIIEQAQLQIVKISDRYYSVCAVDDQPAVIENLEEIVVSGFLSKGISKSSQKIIISPEKVAELPGVTDADILLSLQQLPGVKSPNETATGLHVRGGTPDQNLILWDGIRMYHPGHLFGMISGFNPNIKQTVDFYNKAANPKFGERISSVIDIQTTDEISDAVKVDAGVNAIDADVYFRAPLLKKKLGFQFAARKSITEWIRTPTFNALADKVFQNTAFKDFNDNQFGFHDVSAKLNFASAKRNNFSVTGIAIDNHLDFNSLDDDALPKSPLMDIRNYGSSVEWVRSYNPKLSHSLLVHYSLYTFDYARTLYEPNTFESFTKRNRIVDSGAEVNFKYAPDIDLNIDFGYQFSGNDISHSFKSRTPDLEIELDQKHLYSITHAGFLTVKYILDKWNFNGGLRYNYYSKLDEQTFEPRLFVERKLGDFSWQATYERKSQIARQVRESVANDLSLENYVWILSDNAEYPLQTADQYSTGIIYKTKPFLIDVDFYYKKLNGITSMSFGFLHNFDSAVQNGEGYTKGIDLLLQRSAATWRIWATYSYQDSQNRYERLNDNRYFPISSDLRHAFSLSYYKKWGDFSISTGWFLHTGRPYSELNAENEIAEFNRKRLPTYHRLNISGAYQFQKSDTWNGRIGFAIYNVYDNQTVISKEYERQYGTIGDFVNSGYKVRNYRSLGITPNLFFRISF